MRLRALLVTFATAALVLPAAAAHAVGPVETVVTFDVTAGEFPEGVAVDRNDNVYVSLIAPVSEIRKITPSGDQSAIADLDVGGFGPLGLVFDMRGNLYVAVASFDPATQGVYRVGASGTATRLPGTGAIVFPNGLTVDQRGNIFVTDAAAGAIWRIPRGGAAELWIQDPSLEGTGALGVGVPIGANGIAYDTHTIVVANTERSTLLRIPILANGSAGAPDVVVDDPALFGIDGIALDVHGAVYAAINAQNKIVRVDGGEITTIADDSDGINGASSLAFGTAMGDRLNLFAVNFGVFSPVPTPSLLKMHVGIPGAPIG